MICVQWTYFDMLKCLEACVGYKHAPCADRMLLSLLLSYPKAFYLFLLRGEYSNIPYDNDKALKNMKVLSKPKSMALTHIHHVMGYPPQKKSHEKNQITSNTLKIVPMCLSCTTRTRPPDTPSYLTPHFSLIFGLAGGQVRDHWQGSKRDKVTGVVGKGKLPECGNNKMGVCLKPCEYLGEKDIAVRLTSCKLWPSD